MICLSKLFWTSLCCFKYQRIQSFYLINQFLVDTVHDPHPYNSEALYYHGCFFSTIDIFWNMESIFNMKNITEYIFPDWIYSCSFNHIICHLRYFKSRIHLVYSSIGIKFITSLLYWHLLHLSLFFLFHFGQLRTTWSSHQVFERLDSR